MKFEIWNEISEGLKLCKKLQMYPDEIDETIIDINLGMKNNVIIDKKKKINEMCKDIEFLYIQKY